MVKKGNKIRTLKDVAMEGKEPIEKIARHQAYMNKVNAQVKSMQQTINYAVAMGNHDQYKALLDEFRIMNCELNQAWLDHLALIMSVQNPSRG